MKNLESKKIGLYGGTFNPPHIGHINAVKTMLDGIVDKVIIMPTANPPHKKVPLGDTPESRLEMCKRAFAEFGDRVTISDYEINKGGISYTSDTLEYLSKEYDDIYLLCGTDMFLTLDTWHLPEVIFSHASVVCVLREDNACENEEVILKSKFYKEKYNAKILLPKSNIVEMSSSLIRDKIKLGEDVSEFISESVLTYIFQKGLYK